jgi:hypothetical protein
MANNDQWLFENSVKLRYTGSGLTRDNGTKIIAGKIPFSRQTIDWVTVGAAFGSFFSSGCRPVITAVAESPDNARVDLTIHTWTGPGEIDQTGFTAHAYTQGTEPTLGSGWIHWIAVGY